MFTDVLCGPKANELFSFNFELIMQLSSLSGHFAAPLVAHMFCNHMGFPNFGEVWHYPPVQRILIIFCFLMGFVLWCLLLTTLTSPDIYGTSIHWQTWMYLIFELCDHGNITTLLISIFNCILTSNSSDNIQVLGFLTVNIPLTTVILQLSVSIFLLGNLKSLLI